MDPHQADVTGATSSMIPSSLKRRSLRALAISVAVGFVVTLGCIDFDGAVRAACANPRDCPDAERHIYSKGLGGSGLESVNALTLSQNGGVVMGGFYTGASNLGGSALPESGQTDLFLAGFGVNGEHLWSVGTGGPGNEQARALAQDSFGEVYATGEFNSASLSFANDGGTPLTRQGDTDGFVVRLSPQGQARWQISFGGVSAQVRPRSVVSIPDATGIVLAGTFAGNVKFTGPSTVSSPTEALFVVRVLESGTVQKDVALGTCSGGAITEAAVGIDTSKNLYVVGHHQGTCTVAGQSLTVPASGKVGLFAIKVTSEGAHLWNRSFEEADATGKLAVAVDKKDHLLIAGSYKGAIPLQGGSKLESRTRTSSDALLLKLDRDNGVVLWATSEGGTNNDEGLAVAVDEENNPSLIGSFQESFESRSGETQTSAGATDVFLSQYSETGEAVETLAFGDGAAQSGRALGVDEQGLVLAGQFLGTLKFGGPAVTATGTDIFLARIKTFFQSSSP
jgi:hypothetical protein